MKIDACCAMSSAAKATPAMMPRYLARSPVSIFSAIQFMALNRPELTKYGCRLQHQHSAQTDEGGSGYDEGHGDSGGDGNLPGHVVGGRDGLQLRAKHLFEHGRQ